MKSDCVQIHPANALEAWMIVLDGFHPERNYREEWIKENAYKGLANGKRDKATGEYPDFDQPQSVGARHSITRLNNHITNEQDAKERACVAVYDKNSDPLKVKNATTKCPKGNSCATLNEDGLFVSAMNQAEKTAKRTKQGAVARGYCLPSWDQTKSNLANPRKREEYQKAEDIIAKQRDRIHELENKKDLSCRRPKKQ